MRPVALACLLGISIALVAGGATTASAQGADRRFAEEPTDGVDIPNTPLAGEHDARAVTYNPGGLVFVRGAELAAALTVTDQDTATSSGAGFGVYAAGAWGGNVLPRVGIGVALEWLDPPRALLEPDPGQPFRFTITQAQSLGPHIGIGVAWHHYLADGALSGVDTFDAGFSARLGAELAIGGVVRDLVTGTIANTPVQRRYELEAVFRPLSSDALELAIGGRFGETRHDIDGWARVSGRVARGVTLHAGVETRELHALDDTATGTIDTDGRDLRATIGVELAFGHASAIAMGTGLAESSDLGGGRHFNSGSFVARWSSTAAESVLGEPPHIERVELAGDIGARELTALVLQLRAIERDPHVVALVVSFDDPAGGWATFQELRAEILRVKRAGKKVFAYMVSGTTRDYLIASAADKIYIDPAGGMRLVGMAGTTLYFRGAFDMLGVTPQFEKIAEYKSAPETFTDIGPSPAAARMHAELFDSMWSEWLAAVADGRHLDQATLQKLVDGGPYTAGQLAKDTRLVDGVGTPEQISEWVVKEIGGIYPIGSQPVVRPDRWERPAIAVIYVDGDITDGKSHAIPYIQSKTAGGETLVAAISAARADPHVKAIVLRIDSPGGSALASELIAREVFATRGVKPIVCSMSDVAASGGYFVAAGCDSIWAEPMTITGSIGIFFGKFDISGLMNKLGVTSDTFKRGERADVESMYRPFTDEERSVLLETLRYSYGRFVGAVAEGRKLSKDDVDAVGRGHVWTGAQATPIKLVDRIGGIADAIDDAKQRAGIADERTSLVELPASAPTILAALAQLVGLADAKAAGSPAGDGASLFALPIVKELLRSVPASVLISPAAPQERLPFELSWGD